jgi:Fe-S-cluster-containing hydrogenase component 2
MAEDIYKQLALHLDDLPGGFPPTATGVELRILRRLFTLKEAEMALHLTLIPEETKVIAHRAKQSVEETTSLLDEMFQKGLISKFEKKGRPPVYMALQFVIGIWEYNVNSLDTGLAEDMEEYFPYLVNFDVWNETPQLRTVPVGQSIDHQLDVLPYEMAEKLIEKQNKCLVAPCICRREQTLLGKGCNKPEESCLVFGLGAVIYEKRGIGRVIDKKEALAILKRADEAGLVLQPSNARDIVNICCCCGCCCGVLKAFKEHPQPSALVSSPFVCTVDRDKCIGCGVCVRRCQMDALELQDDKVVLHANRCIGCGLCVSTCLGDALSLKRKPDSKQKKVPETFRSAMVNLARERGKLKPISTAKMVLKSNRDRLRSRSK